MYIRIGSLTKYATEPALSGVHITVGHTSKITSRFTQALLRYPPSAFLGSNPFPIDTRNDYFYFYFIFVCLFVFLLVKEAIFWQYAKTKLCLWQ